MHPDFQNPFLNKLFKKFLSSLSGSKGKKDKELCLWGDKLLPQTKKNPKKPYKPKWLNMGIIPKLCKKKPLNKTHVPTTSPFV